jgi:hypothetical protein
MSQDLLEIGGAVVALILLTALFHRALRPILEQWIRRRPEPAPRRLTRLRPEAASARPA